MGVINSLFHSSLFLGLVFTFFICFRIIYIQYGGGSFLALVLRTKFFFKWIPRELDLDLGDFPGPGVRQLWRKQGFYWSQCEWVWSDSVELTSFLLHILWTVLQDSGGCCWFRAPSMTNISWNCSLSLTSLCSLSKYSSRLWTFFKGRDLTIGRTL